MDNESRHLLISRGLDGELERKEIAQLYRMVADDPSLTVEMGELARLQEDLAQFSLEVEEQAPKSDLTKITLVAIQREQQQKQSISSRSQQFWQWLLSPKGLAVQPLSFAGGILAALMVVWISPSTLNIPANSITPVANRLNIHDVQFVKAKARVDWTNQFIIPPGGSTRLSLDQSLEPVQIQFETVEPTQLTITHLSTAMGEETVRSFIVTGIGYATLGQPSSGDAVAIENSGQVPVLVYMRNAGGVTVSDYSAKNISQSL
jgi:hypothetical protein